VWPAVPSFARVHDNHVQSVRAVTGQTVYRTNVSGLVNGVKYRVSVQASNDFHGSFPRFGHDVVPCGPPFQPTHLQTHVGRTQVQFSWEWDTRDGNGRDAQLFNVEYTCGDQHAEWMTHATSPQSGVVMSSLFQVPGGVSYVHTLAVWPRHLLVHAHLCTMCRSCCRCSARVRAYTEAGFGAFSALSPARIVPWGVPTCALCHIADHGGVAADVLTYSLAALLGVAMLGVFILETAQRRVRCMAAFHAGAGVLTLVARLFIYAGLAEPGAGPSPLFKPLSSPQLWWIIAIADIFVLRLAAGCLWFFRIEKLELQHLHCPSIPSDEGSTSAGLLDHSPGTGYQSFRFSDHVPDGGTVVPQPASQRTEQEEPEGTPFSLCRVSPSKAGEQWRRDHRWARLSFAGLAIACADLSILKLSISRLGVPCRTSATSRDMCISVLHAINGWAITLSFTQMVCLLAAGFAVMAVEEGFTDTVHLLFVCSTTSTVVLLVSLVGYLRTLPAHSGCGCVGHVVRTTECQLKSKDIDSLGQFHTDTSQAIEERGYVPLSDSEAATTSMAEATYTGAERTSSLIPRQVQFVGPAADMHVDNLHVSILQVCVCLVAVVVAVEPTSGT